MVQLDDRILEHLAEEGDADAWEIGFDLTGTVSPSRVTERCKVLLDAELVDRHEREVVDGRFETYWSITTWGEQFLAGDVDPSLDVPVPSPRPSYATRPSWWAGF
ncbi:repressor phrH2 [Halorubrum lipolyticum]|nr:repressor phrH2 [Halorubrum lipolyticum]